MFFLKHPFLFLHTTPKRGKYGLVFWIRVCHFVSHGRTLIQNSKDQVIFTTFPHCCRLFFNWSFYYNIYFFLNLFDNCCMDTIHMFFHNCYAICYQSFFFFFVSIKNMNEIVVTKQTFHDLKIPKINFFVIFYKIKNLTNCIPIMTFPYFSLSTQCLKVFFHFVPFIKNIFFALVCFVVIFYI